MGLFTKKSDPLTDRAKQLNAQIAALEAEIQRLGDKPNAPSSPRPAHAPASLPRPHSKPEPKAHPAPAPKEPVFEAVDHGKVTAQAEARETLGHYNDLGVRKYDLAALLGRMKRHVGPPTASNPKLLNYLAAGSIQGLRPLRYEKRVARNRFIFLAAVFFLLLWGIIAGLMRF